MVEEEEEEEEVAEEVVVEEGDFQGQEEELEVLVLEVEVEKLPTKPGMMGTIFVFPRSQWLQTGQAMLEDQGWYDAIRKQLHLFRNCT